MPSDFLKGFFGGAEGNLQKTSFSFCQKVLSKISLNFFDTRKIHSLSVNIRDVSRQCISLVCPKNKACRPGVLRTPPLLCNFLRTNSIIVRFSVFERITCSSSSSLYELPALLAVKTGKEGLLLPSSRFIYVTQGRILDLLAILVFHPVYNPAAAEAIEMMMLPV